MKVTELIADFQNQIEVAKKDVEVLEEEFANTKINPYGITKVDFTKRNEILEQITRLEGAVEGLTLAINHCEEFGGTLDENQGD